MSELDVGDVKMMRLDDEDENGNSDINHDAVVGDDNI